MRDDNSYIRTYTGKKFYPLDPRPEEVDIVDIAHALSNICRFTGHVKSFHSVAHHSVLVSQYCSPGNALWGLLHDASEAYLMDIASPLKRQDAMAEYRVIERRVMDAVCDRFNLPREEPDDIRLVDRRIMVTEMRDVCGFLEETGGWIAAGVRPYSTISPLSPKDAEYEFMQRYKQIMSLVGVGNAA